MAWSGTYTISGTNGSTATVTWSVIGQSVENNYSSVTAKVRVNYPKQVVVGESYDTSAKNYITTTATCDIHGYSKTGSQSMHRAMSGATPISSMSASPTHDADGTKSIRISVNYTITSGGGYYSASGSGSFWVDLPTINRQATLLTVPNFTDEENPTITYTNPIGEGVDGLAAAISFDGTNPDIDYRDIDKVGTEYTFELTEEERNILRAGTTGSNTRTVLFYVRTILGDEYRFSYKEATFTIINGEPTIEASVIDTNSTTTALTGDVSTLIRYHSTASASMSIYPQKQATIASKRIEHNGGFTTEDVAIYPNVSGNIFAFIATDNRGNKAEQLIVSPMIDYIRPTANIDTEQKMNTDGEYLVKCSGNYYNDTFGYTDAATMNTITVQYRYKMQGGSYGSWYAMNATVDGNTYTAQAQATGFDYRQTYVFQCRIVDKLNTVLSAEITVRSMPIFHWSGEDFVFEVPVVFNAGTTGGSTGGESGGSSDIDTINGDLTIVGNLRMKGSGNYGNTIYFGDSSYAYITETTDDDLTIKATDINLQGNVYVNGSPIGGGSSNVDYGTWTPTLAASNYVSSYSVRQGWYQKVGNVVTIGWMIKATTTGSGIGTSIKINGCPYTPDVAAFGGGIAHNVYMQGNFTFTGWTIDDSGVIAARGQSCNNTTAANHEITSTVCYGTSGNLMTLSGTICFMV